MCFLIYSMVTARLHVSMQRTDAFARDTHTRGKSLSWLTALLVLLAPVQLLAQNGSPNPGKPEWATPLRLSTDTGEARLEWNPKNGEVVELYRVNETSHGRDGTFYVSGQTLDVYRVDPGDYEFSLQACNKDTDGFPVCGSKSQSLVLTVTEEIWADDPVNDGAAAPIVQSLSAGPEVLRPGLWHNPQKVGQGWSLYWANRLVSSSNPSTPYDLYVIWYSYEARTRTITPICEPPQSPCGNEIEYFNYRPVVATMNLVKAQSNNNYVGAISIKRNGTVFNVGDATVVFGANNAAASISWTATFKKQSLLSATDNIVLLAGSSGSSTTDASHYAGLWGDSSASSFIVDDLGSLSETVEVVFYDGNGDPTWIQAYKGSTPVATDTSLCFYHIQGGYPANLNQAALPGALYTTCDPENATSTSRNGRRYFTDFEVGRFWVNFTLPPGVVDPNQVAGGSVSIGTSGTPATKTKSANFHRIWFSGSNSCQISSSSPGCTVNLTWFTDGDYPDATAYRYNQTTGQRSLIATSTQPTMENQPLALSAVGNYVFELRMSNASTSTLIAVSSAFTVSQAANVSPTAAFNASCTNLACSFTDQSSDSDGSIASRSWNFGDGGTSTAQNPSHSYASAGTYTVALTVTDNQGGTNSTSQSVTVSAAGGAALEVFFDSFENGEWNSLWTEDAQNDWFNSSQRATVGNQSAEVDGSATDAQLISIPVNLQGRSQASITFKWLIESGLDTGEYLAFDVSTNGGSSWLEKARLRGDVDAENSWQTVQVDLTGLSSLRLRFRGRMSSSTEDANVDEVRVVVAASAANTAPQVVVPSSQSTVQGASIMPLAILVSDAENDPVTCSISGLPAGLSESSECTISGTVSAATGVYTVSVTANDGQVNSSPVTFDWTITQGAAASNPDTPPKPAAAPGMAVDTTSTRVGATTGAFRVDESGSATYGIPLLTAPGSGGMAPHISLDYSSQSGNGPLGVGWSLGGLSVITRCSRTLAQDGAAGPRGISLTANDRFCLDGQRLIADVGAYGASGTEYRTEIDGISKIVSNGAAGSGPQSFTVWRKDGSVTQYGGTVDSRIEARTATDTQTVLIWPQNRVTDSAGNYMDYVYTEFSGAAGEPVEFVLANILYTGNTTASTSPYAQIDFIYNTGRADTSVAAVAGAQVRQARLLERVDSRARVNAGSSLTSLRSYHLVYGSDGHGRKALTSVTECNNSSQTYCFQPSTFNWQSSKHQIGSSSISVGNAFNSDYVGLAMADINGDGRPDMLLSENASGMLRFRIATALASGGYSAPGATTYAIPNNGDPDVPVTLHAIDLNADGFQDVIYPTGTDWKALVSNGSSLDAAVTVSAQCCGLAAPVQVRIMDFDGDGLSDLITNRFSSGAGNELVLLRNIFSPASPGAVGFGAPQLLTLNLPANLFPAETSDGWFIDEETVHFENPNTIRAPFDRSFDYNGDGAVDLLVRLRQRYYQCGAGCVANLNSLAVGNMSNLNQFTFSDDAAGAELVAAAGKTYAWASFYVVLVSDGGANFVHQEVVATGTDCSIYDACNPYAALPKIERAQAVDINADGLADFAYEDGSFNWKARINLGGGFRTTDISIATLADSVVGRQAVFLDTTGDGLPEFLYPSLLGSSSAVWKLHENQHGSAFGTAQTSSAKFGNSADFDSSILVDINGDGMLDNLFVDLSGGQVQTSTTRVYLGNNSVIGAPGAQAMNLISGITDGFGAQTTVTYKPLTEPSVYTRMRDARSASWGSGYAVYDLIAPIYVVSQAQSSAPVFGGAGATSAVEYHYVGAKLQGGGRGFLGFGEVISYDPQSAIRTNTRYRQDFPFIGLPADTTRALTSSSHKFDAISDPLASSPQNWVSISASAAAPALDSSGALLSYAINEWGVIETVNAQAWFPYIAGSLERSYTLTGGFSHKVLTANTYNSYGDLTQVVVKTYAADDTSVYATQTSNHNYLAANTSKWHLGRLSRSSVAHARSGLTSITRTSGFAYASVTGILKQEVIEPDLTAFKVTTDYQLDAFGNRTMATVSGSGFTSRSSASSYDPLGRFVIEARNAYNQVTQKIISWDAFGNALAADDIDGVRTTAAADPMGRPFISYSVTGAWSKTIQRSGAGSYCPAGDTAFYSLTTGGGQPSQYHCFDRLGREVRTATQGFDGSLIHIDRYYDESGRPQRVSEPYFSGSTRYWNQTAYDALGRIDSVLAADGNHLTYDYDQSASACSVAGAARQVKITNGLSQSQLELRNALGETVAVYDNACGAVSHTYDAVGNLTRVTGADGAVTTTIYDLSGRKTSMNDPDKGNWQYAYNALGELTRQIDSKSQAIDFAYDNLGRVVDRWERTGVSSLGDGSYATVNRETTTWNNSTSTSVKGKGQITASVYRSGETGAVVQQRNYSYDGLGRPGIVSTLMDGLQLTEETTYDEYGRVFQQFDAAGDDHGIHYHYNARGFVEKLQEAREGTGGAVYQQIQGMDARGNVTYIVLGNGVEAFATYQANSGRIDVLEAYDAQGVELQFVSYTFDVAGNLLSRHDTSQSQNLFETFDYDLLNRLGDVMLSVAGAATRNTLSLQYDVSGNISYKSDVGSYLYGQSGAGPHAVTNAGGLAYTYDINGNQTSSSNGRTISYSVFDQALHLQKGSEFTDFYYGIGNQRIKRVDDNAIDQVKTTWYFGNTERIQPAAQNAYFKRYLGGIAIADYYPATQQQNILYLVKDHLGSVHTTVTESGLVANASGMSFGAFGERRSADWSGPLALVLQQVQNDKSTRGFTGHEHADGLGIIHMNGRIYDPKLGRFLQADPFVQAPNNTQSLNRYSYVFNNPLSYTDPSGYFSLNSLWKKIRPFAAIGISIYLPQFTIFWQAIGVSIANTIAVGGITGAIAGYVASGNLTGAVAGAFAGAAFGALHGWNAVKPLGQAAKSVTHGLVGGVQNLIQGSKFGHGFLSAGATQGLAGGIDKITDRTFRVMAAAAIGGTMSEITGGKFANGAVTGAFSRALNEEINRRVLRNPDRRQPGLYVTGHKIPGLFATHLAVEYVPADGSDPFWISAGPLGMNIFEGAEHLVSDVNRPSDVPIKNFTVGQITPPVGLTAGDYYNRLLLIDSAYCDCVDYDLTPGAANGFNSNSYARSIIQHTGGVTSINFYRYFGGADIIPKRYFGLE